MYRIYYKYNHGTWIEPCDTGWLNSESDVIAKLKYIKSKGAIDIKVIKAVNVTKEFEQKLNGDSQLKSAI